MWKVFKLVLSLILGKILEVLFKLKRQVDDAEEQRENIEAKDEVSAMVKKRELEKNVDKIIEEMEERNKKPLEERMKDAGDKIE